MEAAIGPRNQFVLRDQHFSALEKNVSNKALRAWTWGSAGTVLGVLGAVAGSIWHDALIAASGGAFLVAASALGSSFAGRRTVKRRTEERITAAITKLARDRGGRVTAIEAAEILEIGLDEATRFLDNLARRSQVGVDIDEAGRTVYLFP